MNLINYQKNKLITNENNYTINQFNIGSRMNHDYWQTNKGKSELRKMNLVFRIANKKNDKKWTNKSIQLISKLIKWICQNTCFI